MKVFHLLIFLLALTLNISSQSSLLKSGPMVGYSAMREVAVWVQTNKEAKVKMAYWPKGANKNIKFTNEVNTVEQSAFTSHLVASLLEPSTTYFYQIFINGKPITLPYECKFQTQTLWKWRADPPDFSFMIGSCFYINETTYDRPGTPYGNATDIFISMQKDSAQFMIWLGDNNYLREVDWDSRSGVFHRYSHSRNIKNMQPFLANKHHYAIWDDHDYGPNDSDRSYYGKQWTNEAFKAFWANPIYGLGDEKTITSAFTWSDADFFLMDNRTNRTPQSKSGQIYGQAQLTWLVEALRSSPARYKFVCTGGQFLNDAPVYENHVIFAQERQALLDSIDKYKIKNVVFLTGDRHFSEISTLTTPGGTKIHDITSSPVTSGFRTAPNEPNHNRVAGSHFAENSYAVLSIAGKGNDRKVKVDFKDKMGKVIYSYMLD
jgi:alkaline phosphatase D